MLDAATQQKIRRLHLVTRRLMNGPLTGDANTLRKGYGVEFHQIREYQTGDDVRFIDWRGSARFGRLLVKECLEERNRTVIVAVDVSGSSTYGSDQTRINTLREIADILLVAGHYARDSIGLILFADEIVQEIPAKNSSAHIHVLENSLYAHAPQPARTTNLAKLFTHIARRWHKDALVFVISDFIDTDFHTPLRMAAHGADIVAIRCIDRAERDLSAKSFVLMHDIELGVDILVNVQNSQVKTCLKTRLEKQNTLFEQAGVDVLDVDTGTDAYTQLLLFFKRRTQP